MERFFNRVINLRKPIYIVNDHHELLPEINKMSPDQLVNMDFHSDITCYVDRRGGVYEYHASHIPGDLNCGTWVNFVKGHETGEFLWIYPHDHCLKNSGRCEDIEGFWKSENSDYHNWGKITCKKGWARSIPWVTVSAIGIALSSPWLYRELEDYFLFEIYPMLEARRARTSTTFRDYLREGKKHRYKPI